MRAFRYGEPGLLYCNTAGTGTIAKIREGGWDYVVLQDQSDEYFQLKPPLFWDYGNDHHINPRGQCVV